MVTENIHFSSNLYHPPSGTCSLASYIPFKSLVIQIPHPLKIFDDLLWCGYGYFWMCTLTGLEKSAVQLSRTSRFSFWARKVHRHLPVTEGIGQVVCQLNNQNSKQRLARASKFLELLVARESWNSCFFFRVLCYRNYRIKKEKINITIHECFERNITGNEQWCKILDRYYILLMSMLPHNENDAHNVMWRKFSNTPFTPTKHV